MGCQRLSALGPPAATATLHAALDSGVTLLDTADVYGPEGAPVGHGERLVASALRGWTGDRSRVRVATKAGLTRPGWVPDGRARHLREACARSLEALEVARLDLFQLHAPDPRTPFATSVRALGALQREGLVDRVGLCNLSLAQLDEARGLTDVASVQVQLSPWYDENVRSGLVGAALAAGLRVLAWRPLGGADGRRRLAREPVLASVAQRLGVDPALVVLAWLRSLSPLLVPLPGPTRPETARELGRPLELGDADRAAIDACFPWARMVREPSSSRRPAKGAPGDVVLVIGVPGAGKSSLAQDLVADGYARLNRDERGGTLRSLIPLLREHLRQGSRRVVLDNTYGSRAARNEVVEAAWAEGVPVRAVWVDTGLEDAQVNVASRILDRYGHLPGPQELKAASRSDPAALAPTALFRHRREFEPPREDEGFARIDRVPFRRRPSTGTGRGVLLWYDGVVRTTRSGDPRPRAADDTVLLPGRREALHRLAGEGHVLLGLSWNPEVAQGRVTAEEIEASFGATSLELGLEVPVAWCPHGDGPPTCWCRRPLPGLGVLLLREHGLDPSRSLYVGRDVADRALARALGLTFRDAADVFGA
jgi:aryl-alcohol dehydrogenase-like predicted oxidoreductase/predicted kinase/histidinol phosphatase-like enzyme